MRETVTREALSEAIQRAVGLARADAVAFVESLLEEISIALTQGDFVKVSGFGTFTVKQKGCRMGRNPRTREEVPIGPRKALIFRASHVLKDRMNQRQRGLALLSNEAQV